MTRITCYCGTRTGKKILSVNTLTKKLLLNSTRKQKRNLSIGTPQRWSCVRLKKHCKVKSCGVYLLFDESPQHLFSISDGDLSDQEDDYYSLYSSSSSAEDSGDEIDHENGDSKSGETSPATSFFFHRKGYLLLLCFLTFAYLFLSWTSQFCFAPQFIPPPPT
uniref:Uncharacterized protein n=1 Tax=Populus alba TaxID=43335 RepID=A0A4U5Q3G4_POPAL|nr:hypothetical protein D5086_0000141190 [Populus alba]